jgi:hypothetical protein
MTSEREGPDATNDRVSITVTHADRCRSARGTFCGPAVVGSSPSLTLTEALVCAVSGIGHEPGAGGALTRTIGSSRPPSLW